MTETWLRHVHFHLGTKTETLHGSRYSQDQDINQVWGRSVNKASVSSHNGTRRQTTRWPSSTFFCSWLLLPLIVIEKIPENWSRSGDAMSDCLIWIGLYHSTGGVMFSEHRRSCMHFIGVCQSIITWWMKQKLYSEFVETVTTLCAGDGVDQWFKGTPPPPPPARSHWSPAFSLSVRSWSVRSFLILGWSKQQTQGAFWFWVSLSLAAHGKWSVQSLWCQDFPQK